MSNQAKTLTEKQFNIVRAVALAGNNGLRNELMLMFSYYAGLRAKEIAALHIGDVMNANGTIKEEMKLKSSQVKGSHGATVFLNSKLRVAIKKFLEHHNQTRLDQPVFRSMRTMGYLRANSVRNELDRIYTAAGFDNCSSHTGRRSFITNLSKKGVETRVIQQLARHASLQTTQRYIDTSPERLRNAIELL